jgi:hypothetical protein
MAWSPVEAAYHKNRNLTIGSICFQWSHLEYLLSQTIWSLLRIDEDTGKILTGGLDIQPRVNMAIALARHLNAPRGLVTALVEVRTALNKDLVYRRNRAIHGHRRPDPNEPASELVEVHRGKGDRTRHPQTNDDLVKIVDDTNDLFNVLYDALRADDILDASVSRPIRIVAKKTARNTSPNRSPSSS